jgi:tRNA-dihydrouridine synthase 1
MVDQSELPFRILCRQHGATLAYTPMMHARLCAQSERLSAKMFDPAPGAVDRPLIAQFAGSDAASIIAAARRVQDRVDGVDLNFGCPQGIAQRGGYGAFLLETDWDWLVAMVAEVAAALRVPLTIKLRLVMDEAHRPSVDRTVELCRRLEAAGVSLIALHGRTRLEIKQQQRSPDWTAIATVKRALRIPVVANGGIYTRADVDACLAATGADGVMSAEGLLEDPSLFAHTPVAPSALAAEYLELAKLYPPVSLKPVRGHVFKLLHADAMRQPQLARALQTARGMDAVVRAADELIGSRLTRRRDDDGARDPLVESWYHRHRVQSPDAPGPGVGRDDDGVAHAASEGAGAAPADGGGFCGIEGARSAKQNNKQCEEEMTLDWLESCEHPASNASVRC